MKKENKLPKRQDGKDTTLESPQPVDVPEPKHIDLMREIKTLRGDLGIAIEAVKALGADVIENNNMQSAAMTDLNHQMQELQRAFINVVSKGFEAPATTPKQTMPSDLGDLESLPWKDNKYGQYIFRYQRDSNQVTQGAEKLVEALLKAEKHSLKFDGRTYRLSGDGYKFVNRSE